MKHKRYIPLFLALLLLSGCNSVPTEQPADDIPIFASEQSSLPSSVPYVQDLESSVSADIPDFIMTMDNAQSLFAPMGFSPFELISPEDTEPSLFRASGNAGVLEAEVDANGVVNALCLSCTGINTASNSFSMFISCLVQRELTADEISTLSDTLSSVMQLHEKEFASQITYELDTIPFFISYEADSFFIVV